MRYSMILTTFFLVFSIQASAENTSYEDLMLNQPFESISGAGNGSISLVFQNVDLSPLNSGEYSFFQDGRTVSRDELDTAQSYCHISIDMDAFHRKSDEVKAYNFSHTEFSSMTIRTTTNLSGTIFSSDREVEHSGLIIHGVFRPQLLLKPSAVRSSLVCVSRGDQPKEMSASVLNQILGDFASIEVGFGDDFNNYILSL